MGDNSVQLGTQAVIRRVVEAVNSARPSQAPVLKAIWTDRERKSGGALGVQYVYQDRHADFYVQRRFRRDIKVAEVPVSTYRSEGHIVINEVAAKKAGISPEKLSEQLKGAFEKQGWDITYVKYE